MKKMRKICNWGTFEWRREKMEHKKNMLEWRWRRHHEHEGIMTMRDMLEGRRNRKLRQYLRLGIPTEDEKHEQKKQQQKSSNNNTRAPTTRHEQQYKGNILAPHAQNNRKNELAYNLVILRYCKIRVMGCPFKNYVRSCALTLKVYVPSYMLLKVANANCMG